MFANKYALALLLCMCCSGMSQLWAQQDDELRAVIRVRGGVYFENGIFFPSLDVARGSSILLDASGSNNPSGQELKVRWWIGRWVPQEKTFAPVQGGLESELWLDTTIRPLRFECDVNDGCGWREFDGATLLYVFLHIDDGTNTSDVSMVIDIYPFTGRRGDANRDGVVDLSDAVVIFDYLFSGGRRPLFVEYMDADSSGSVNINDALYILNYLYDGGPAPGPDGEGTPFDHSDWSTFYE